MTRDLPPPISQIYTTCHLRNHCHDSRLQRKNESMRYAVPTQLATLKPGCWPRHRYLITYACTMSEKRMEIKFVICFLILFHHSQSLPDGPVVRILQGKLEGVIEKSIICKRYVAFRGIPYGKPPIGELRFRDPLPAEPWTSILNASRFGQNCAQLDRLSNTYVGDDDCLYLNVYTQPEFETICSSPKPVMFWIHGGGFQYGSGDDVLYGPDYFIAKNVVLVTMNYRLGVIGFLNLEDEVATGNQGLKDLILALKWVQQNIAHFGGDPKSVTIFGGSAGAASVHALTLSPLADGLYHKAIAQSGVMLNPWASLPYSPKLHAQELAAALGFETEDPKELVEFFRSIDAQRLAQVDTEVVTNLSYAWMPHFVPSDDSKSTKPFFPIGIKTALRSGVNVPFLFGYMSHEGIIELAGMNNEKWRLYDSRIEESLSPSEINLLRNKGITFENLREIYFGDKNISQATRANYVQMQSDLQFIYGIHDIAEIQAFKTNSSTYMYRFSYDNGQSIIKKTFGIDIPGAAHTDELSYLFYPKIMKMYGFSPAAPGSRTRLVIDRVTQMWTDFAKTGNPTPIVSDLVRAIWKPITNAENFESMEISQNLKMETVTNINKRYADVEEQSESAMNV